jgi:hypothetical protein
MTQMLSPTTREFPKRRPPTWNAVAPGYYVSSGGCCYPVDPNNIPGSSGGGGNPPNMAPMPDAEWITDKLESSYKPPIGELGIENRPPHPSNT